jgi:uncharacterized zinc-type alcohol dehydrogenase-like protein
MEPNNIPIGDDEEKVVAWGLESADGKHKPVWIPRGKVGDEHVKFDLLYCGVCHSDVHIGENIFGGCSYPCVTGHELFGRVTEVGSKVTKVQVGDYVGVGCMVDSCLSCSQCENGDEQYCLKGNTNTYQSTRKHGRVPGNQSLTTYGGYSASNTVHEHFIIKVPEGIPHEKVGPILCAGITLYDPLKYWGAAGEKKLNIGVIGIGGLGTMGIKFAAAMGNNVVAISTSASKEALAREKGATGFICSTDPESMAAHARSLDLILNTVSFHHDLNPYMGLLAKNGTIVMMGIIAKPMQFNQVPLFVNR